MEEKKADAHFHTHRYLNERIKTDAGQKMDKFRAFLTRLTLHYRTARFIFARCVRAYCICIHKTIESVAYLNQHSFTYINKIDFAREK